MTGEAFKPQRKERTNETEKPADEGGWGGGGRGTYDPGTQKGRRRSDSMDGRTDHKTQLQRRGKEEKTNIRKWEAQRYRRKTGFGVQTRGVVVVGEPTTDTGQKDKRSERGQNTINRFSFLEIQSLIILTIFFSLYSLVCRVSILSVPSNRKSDLFNSTQSTRTNKRFT